MFWTWEQGLAKNTTKPLWECFRPWPLHLTTQTPFGTAIIFQWDAALSHRSHKEQPLLATRQASVWKEEMLQTLIQGLLELLPSGQALDHSFTLSVMFSRFLPHIVDISIMSIIDNKCFSRNKNGSLKKVTVYFFLYVKHFKSILQCIAYMLFIHTTIWKLGDGNIFC